MARGNFWEKPGSMGVEMRDGFLYDSIIRLCLPTEQEVYFRIYTPVIPLSLPTHKIQLGGTSMFKKSSLYALVSLLFIATMILSACGAPAKPTEVTGSKVPVGIVLPTKDEPRWLQDETRFKDALTAAGYEVQILFSQGDSAKEKANVESLISQGIKVLIICPQDGTAAAAAAQAARDAGVKVISYDRLIRDTDAVDYYVTFDSVAVGEAWGQYLIDQAKGKDNNLYL
jgi:putative multiple sugar transport system substrate-binding protein